MDPVVHQEDSNYNWNSENKMMLLHLHRCIFQIIETTIFALLDHSQWEKMGNCSKLLQMSHLMQAEKVLLFIEIVLQYQQPEAANLARFSKKKIVWYSAYSFPLFKAANNLCRHPELVLFSYSITSSVSPQKITQAFLMFIWLYLLSMSFYKKLKLTSEMCEKERNSKKI